MYKRQAQDKVFLDIKLCKGSLKERHIFASKKYEKNALKLVPDSQNHTGVVLQRDAKAPKGDTIQMQMKLKEHGGEIFIANFAAASAPKVDASSHPLAKELIVPFWMVRTTADKGLANMERSQLKSTLSYTPGGDECKGGEVIIPILTNFRVIKETEELLVYSSQQVTPAVSIEPQPPAKRSASSKRQNSRPKRVIRRR